MRGASEQASEQTIGRANGPISYPRRRFHTISTQRRQMRLKHYAFKSLSPESFLSPGVNGSPTAAIINHSVIARGLSVPHSRFRNLGNTDGKETRVLACHTGMKAGFMDDCRAHVSLFCPSFCSQKSLSRLHARTHAIPHALAHPRAHPRPHALRFLSHSR